MNDNNFTTQRTGTGIAEWADKKYAFEVGCEIGCHYCWARAGMVRRKMVDSPEAWLTPRTNMKKVNKGWRKHDGIVMFPATHNITPRNLENSIKILRSMLSAGNFVLITIKPSCEIIKQLTGALMPFKQQILFRFSIGSYKDDVLKSWEPNGPSFEDRMNALKIAHWLGFKTSVAAEPLLGGVETAIALTKATRNYITHDLWFGYMRKIKQRVITQPTLINGRTPLSVDEIRYIHSGPTAMLLERFAQHNNEFVRLKDSVRESAKAFRHEIRKETS